MQTDEAVLCVEEFAQGTVGQFEQLVEIARRDDALHDFGDDLTLRCGPLPLSDVNEGSFEVEHFRVAPARDPHIL